MFGSKQKPASERGTDLSTRLDRKAPPIDVSKRYDVYSHGFGRRTYVYSNVRFKEPRSLPLPPEHFSDIGDRFWLVEQEDGSEIYLPSMGICLFCEHGTKPNVQEWSLSR